jgi:hypothetical protein
VTRLIPSTAVRWRLTHGMDHQDEEADPTAIKRVCLQLGEFLKH